MFVKSDVSYNELFIWQGSTVKKIKLQRIISEWILMEPDLDNKQWRINESLIKNFRIKKTVSEQFYFKWSNGSQNDVARLTYFEFVKERNKMCMDTQ